MLRRRVSSPTYKAISNVSDMPNSIPFHQEPNISSFNYEDLIKTQYQETNAGSRRISIADPKEWMFAPMEVSLQKLSFESTEDMTRWIHIALTQDGVHGMLRFCYGVLVGHPQYNKDYVMNYLLRTKVEYPKFDLKGPMLELVLRCLLLPDDQLSINCGERTISCLVLSSMSLNMGPRSPENDESIWIRV